MISKDIKPNDRGKNMIQTNRLILREMTPNDFDALFKILGDEETMQHYPAPFDANGVRGWINRNINRYQTFGFGLWAVCLRDTGELIGDCGLTMQNINGEIKPEIGYHIRKDRQRQGYAAEAAAAVRDWAFENTPFNILYSYMKYTNEASAKTALSYGCSFVDKYEDSVNTQTLVFAITRDQWQKRQEV